MYKLILRSLEDAALFAVVAFLIFFIFFVALLVYVIRMKRSYVEHMSDLPLKDTPVNPIQNRISA
ncbi:MAG: cbb3-type cytochrome c oxidase subunit 3 [Bacteroidota bacterium]